MLVIAIGIVSGIVSSCSSSVDLTDPRSVAETAMKSYVAGDWETLKTCVNPKDKHILRQLDMFEENSSETSSTESAKPEFVKVVEEFTGREISATSRSAVATFNTSQFPSKVVLYKDKVDGNWYVERFK